MPRKGGTKKMRRKESKKTKKPSPNIVAEIHARIEGKPSIIRVYRKSWKYKNNLVATVSVGKKKMEIKTPRLGKHRRKKKR